MQFRNELERQPDEKFPFSFRHSTPRRARRARDERVNWTFLFTRFARVRNESLRRARDGQTDNIGRSAQTDVPVALDIFVHSVFGITRGMVAVTTPATRRDVPTPVIGRLSLSHVGIVALRVEPVCNDPGARETIRRVLETTLNEEISSLHSAFANDDEKRGDGSRKTLRVIGMSSDTYVCVSPRKYVEATKMVCAALKSDDKVSSRLPMTVSRVILPSSIDEEMHVLRSMIPALVMDAFKDVNGWCSFGETDAGMRYMTRDFWPSKPNEMTTACGVEIERGLSIAKAPCTLHGDIGDQRDIEIMFPSVSAVVLRLQRLGSVIDAMRLAGVSNEKLRSFINGSAVIEIPSTPVMVQAAPEIGVEAAVVAFRRELPKECGFKTIEEFRCAFETRLGTVIPPHSHTDDSKEELLADVCFSGHDTPYLWPVSLLLKSTGGTELTARASNIANDTVLAFLHAATQVPILGTNIAFQVHRREFMSQSATPKHGPLLPDREIFVSAAQNKNGWPAFSARDNNMPSSFEVWINPFQQVESIPEIFSPQQPISPHVTNTPLSALPSVKTPGEYEPIMNATFFGNALERMRDLSPSRLMNAIPKASSPTPLPVLGSRVTSDGIQSSQPPKKRRKKETKKWDPKKCKYAAKVAKIGDVAIEEVPFVLSNACAFIEAGDYDKLTTKSGDNSIRDAAAALRRSVKKDAICIYKDSRMKNKKELIDILIETLGLVRYADATTEKK